ncbi:unnamed protein product [Amoebophrya sp. A25]|nr:unnamed protein product [Amoebophrya sp. A25]|eukprot:GSA25T00005611001.1
MFQRGSRVNQEWKVDHKPGEKLTERNQERDTDHESASFTETRAAVSKWGSRVALKAPESKAEAESVTGIAVGVFHVAAGSCFAVPLVTMLIFFRRRSRSGPRMSRNNMQEALGVLKSEYGSLC